MLNADKKEVDGLIRDKYRQLERTSRVNLAYSVLKNQTLRDDYLWLFENSTMINMLLDVFSLKKVQKPVSKRSIPHNPIEKILLDALSKKPGGRR